MPKPPAPLDWSAALAFPAALVTLHYEIQGDWYRDPWGWPELDWMVKKDLEWVITRLNGTGAKRVAKIDVPKENFGTRPAVVIDPTDRLIYQALVDRHSVELIGDLEPWVFGWRLQTKDPKPGQWSHNDIQHSNFREVLSKAASVNQAALRTDVVSCFASVDLDRLCETVTSHCGSSRMTQRLTEMLMAWGNVSARSGLPQRSTASAALANLYLAPVDDVLRAYEKRRKSLRRGSRGTLRTMGGTPRVARWMDDIWVLGQDAGDLRVIQLELQHALRSVGLEINHHKTDVLEGPDVGREIKQIQHSAIDDALIEASNNQPLLELVEQLLEEPTKADRTSVKFATKRMRDHEVFDPVPDFAEKANAMPHAADALARLFRDSDHWRELPDWYATYAKSPWGVMNWSVAQLGTAFPTKVTSKTVMRSLEPVKTYFFEQLSQIKSLPLVAVAAQRLASWDRIDTRTELRAACDASGDPHVRRVFALAALGAGEERAVVRRMLSEFEENSVTLRMLEGSSFRVKTKPDFEG